MAYRKEVFVEQLPLVDCFARHLVHYRAVKSRLGDYRPGSWFWNDTCNAHLLQATIYWCMVFGSHGTNQTHLRNLAIDEVDELQKSFRAHLLAALRIDEATWKSYWEDMRAFRDKYAAHRELGFDRPVPRFDLALEAAFCYEEWVREVITPDVVDGRPLRHLISEWEEAVAADVVAALNTLNAEQRLPSARPRPADPAANVRRTAERATSAEREKTVDGQSDQVTQQILGKIGSRVTFLYPAAEGNAEGTLRDRYVLPVSSRGNVPYWDVIDLIDFPNEPVRDWIRVGYYRKPGDRLVWGSQTTITEPVATWKRLLVGAAREKRWFRELVEEVVRELAEGAPDQGAATGDG